MSVRYDRDRLREASRDYVDHVMAFMSGHIEGKGVVEIGSGTGRISERLIDTVAPRLTCVELSPAMIVRHRERLGDRAKEVSYEEGFAQDVLRNRQYDVAICSLVLIHNVDPAGFQELLDALCRTHSEIFVFEDVRQDRQPGPATRLRHRDELIDAFRARHFEVRAEDRHRLFDDEVLFLNLARRT